MKKGWRQPINPYVYIAADPLSVTKPLISYQTEYKRALTAYTSIIEKLKKNVFLHIQYILN